MQVILGSSGTIGRGVAKLLPQYTNNIRLVSRDPAAVNPDDELFKADLTDMARTAEAVAGSEIAYLTAGLPYRIDVWEEQWPRIMNNVIEACVKHGSKLVFFDNVYMYGRVEGWMTESTQTNPCSRKGEVRARIAARLMDEVDKGGLTALIARAADFYGPTANALPTMLVFDKLKNGKKAQWLLTDRTRHSFTYTEDAVRGTALLGNTPDAYGRIWHLPTDKKVKTGREFIHAIAGALGTDPGYSVLNPWMLRLGGWFDRNVKESLEMLYQYQYDYLFDSGDFQRRFFKATPYEEGIEETASKLQ